MSIFNNKLILGTVQMGLNYGINNSNGKIPYDECSRILKYAYENGIRNLDCAESYGHAHKLIGKFHFNNSNKIFKISTKVNEIKLNNNISDKIKYFINELNISYLENFMFHSYKSYCKNLKNLSQLQNLKKEKIINKIGVSVYSNKEIKDVINNDCIDLIQIPFNLLDNFSLKGDLIKEAKERGKIVQCRSVFLQGLFFKEEINNNDSLVVKNLRNELLKLKELSLKNNISISDLALSYVLSQDYIDQILIGVDNLAQLKENLISANFKINNEITNSIENIITRNKDFLNPVNWKKK